MRSRLLLALPVAALLGGGLAASPAQAQIDIQQFLQGLTTGNPREDKSLRDAFERGYERGRQDEMRRQRASRDDRRDDRSTQREREDARRDDPMRFLRPDSDRR